MRIAIASLMEEANSFSPIPTTVATFESYYFYRGDELIGRYGEARTEVPGFLAVLKEFGATPAPLIAAYAAASGTVTRFRTRVRARSLTSLQPLLPTPSAT